jgi:hypothetical protein
MHRFVLLAGFAVALWACRGAGSAPGPAAGQTADATASPRHDIAGTWEPANGPGDGIGQMGTKAMPNDGKPEHQLPYTPHGLATYKSHKALEGIDAVLPGNENDPKNACEPIGFPRTDHYNMRQTQILQNDLKVVVLYQYAQTWRVIWTDGRGNPREIVEPRFYGYSTGTWADDTTLVVQTVGMMPEDRVWLDTTGRPISDEARVEERWHRVSRDRLELTVTINDPKIYTKPWVSLDRWPMKLADPHLDVGEMYCSPSEMARYNELLGYAAGGVGKNGGKNGVKNVGKSVGKNTEKR